MCNESFDIGPSSALLNLDLDHQKFLLTKQRQWNCHYVPTRVTNCTFSNITNSAIRNDGKMESDLLNVAESFSFIAFRPSEVHLLKDAEKF